MVSISETTENQSHNIQHNTQQQQTQQQQQEQQQQERQHQQQIQQELIKSIQLYHNQQNHNKIMSEKQQTSQEKPTTPAKSGEIKKEISKNIGTVVINKQIKTTTAIADEETGKIITATAATTNITTSIKPPKSAVSQRSIEIEIDKSGGGGIKPRNLRLDLVTTKSEDHSMKSPKTPKTPKSPLSAAGRLSHQTSLSSQIDIVEDRKTLRDALYQGIFHRHRKTIFAMGSFLRMLRSRNSQYNTIRSSSEGEDIDDAR